MIELLSVLRHILMLNNDIYRKLTTKGPGNRCVYCGKKIAYHHPANRRFYELELYTINHQVFLCVAHDKCFENSTDFDQFI